MELNSRIGANRIKTEKQLAELLLHCDIPNHSPDELDYMGHWWQKEWIEDQNRQPPIARAFREIYCLAVEENKFVLYWLDEINWWFSAIGGIVGEMSVVQFKDTLEQLCNTFESSLKYYYQHR
jgi:hypothetical protein